jgi:hypothetical protein
MLDLFGSGHQDDSSSGTERPKRRVLAQIGDASTCCRCAGKRGETRDSLDGFLPRYCTSQVASLW